MGHWEPTAEDYYALMHPAIAANDDPGRPYPFFLGPPAGRPTARAWRYRRVASRVEVGRHPRQLIRRQGEVLVWSRGEELVTDRFPEVRGSRRRRCPTARCSTARSSPGATSGRCRSRRCSGGSAASKLSAKVLADAPVVFMAFDVLELGGRRYAGTAAGRAARAARSARRAVARRLGACGISPLVAGRAGTSSSSCNSTARERSVEGLMLKRRDRPTASAGRRATGGSGRSTRSRSTPC